MASTNLRASPLNGFGLSHGARIEPLADLIGCDCQWAGCKVLVEGFEGGGSNMLANRNPLEVGGLSPSNCGWRKTWNRQRFWLFCGEKKTQFLKGIFKAGTSMGGVECRNFGALGNFGDFVGAVGS